MTFGLDPFGTVRPVRVELITAGCRVNGTIQTRFNRVAEILNQLSSSHLPVADASVREHASDEARPVETAIVMVDEILVMVAPELVDVPTGDMRVPKQPIRAQLAVPPLWLHGTVYVPVGSRPTDGLLNVADRFIPMTDVAICSVAYPALDHDGPVAAVRRDAAHVIVFEEVATSEAGENAEEAGAARF